MKKNVNIWLTLSILLLAVFSATILPAEQEYAGKSPAKPQNPQSEIGEGGNRRLGNACLRANTHRQAGSTEQIGFNALNRLNGFDGFAPLNPSLLTKTQNHKEKS